MQNRLIAMAACFLLSAPLQAVAQDQKDIDNPNICVIWGLTIAQCAMGDMNACARIPPEASRCAVGG